MQTFTINTYQLELPVCPICVLQKHFWSQPWPSRVWIDMDHWSVDIRADKAICVHQQYLLVSLPLGTEGWCSISDHPQRCCSDYTESVCRTVHHWASLCSRRWDKMGPNKGSRASYVCHRLF